MVTHTDDGRYIVVDGRRWRATDPHLPEDLRRELVAELMSARRAVRAAAGDADATRLARARVQDAKVALGERGEPWWSPQTTEARRRRRDAAARTLSRVRHEDQPVRDAELDQIIGEAPA